ncbi:MAG: heme anaerobic degradation radical SAM methyltransferase ChuW/HutW [Verrucomicrobiota bacterium]
MMSPLALNRIWSESGQRARNGRPHTVYLHVPFCKKRCDFCPFFINRFNGEALENYVDALEAEIRLTAAQGGIGEAPIRAVYFGGGTPSDLAPGHVRRLLTALRREFRLAPDCEITMEGRVYGTSGELARQWQEAGINRVSLGVQTFNTRMRRLLGRIEPRDKVLQVLNELTEVEGITVNIDLLYGLPGQSTMDLLDELETICERTDLHGFDLYHLKLFPGTALDRAIADGKLPPLATLREKARQYTAASRWLQSTDYRQITTCHWVRDPRERSRYNQLAKGTTNIIPLGSGAGGRLGGHQFYQVRQLEDYLCQVRQGFKPLMMGAGRGRYAALKDTLSLEFEHGYLSRRTRHNLLAAAPKAEPMLRRWAGWGLLEAAERTGHAHRLTTRGRFWSPEMLTHLGRALPAEEGVPRGHHG